MRYVMGQVARNIKESTSRIVSRANGPAFSDSPPLSGPRFILIGCTVSHKSKCLFSSHVESAGERAR